jgi:hypothetical protein
MFATINVILTVLMSLLLGAAAFHFADIGQNDSALIMVIMIPVFAALRALSHYAHK